MYAVTILVKLCLAAQLLTEVSSFVAHSTKTSSAMTSMQLAKENDEPKQGGLFQALGNFWEELDAFMDDAS
jgi:hypothetical protein